MPEDSAKRISEHDIFLYNQSPTAGKGIACLAFMIVDAFNDTIEYSDEMDTCVKNPPFDVPTLDEIKSFTNTCPLASEDSNDSELFTFFFAPNSSIIQNCRKLLKKFK